MDNFYTANIERYKFQWQQYGLQYSDNYADEILRQAKTNKNSIKTDADDFLLVTTILWEPDILDEIEIYKNLFDSFNKRKIKTILIINSFYKDMDLSELHTDVYFVDWLLWRSFDKIINQRKSAVNTNWNMNAEKFLFLTGKPQYWNRVRLLYKIIKRGLIGRCTWSFFMTEETRNKCRSVLSDISDDEFEMLFDYYNHPDEIKMMVQPSQGQGAEHDSGTIPEITRNPLQQKFWLYSYHVKLFRDSLFRVVAETQFDPGFKIYQPQLTEKTFITILNKIPFILASDNGSLDKLKKMGFKTFENFLPVQDYDQIQDSDQKLDAIITNASYWLDKMTNKTKINADVEHNYKNFLRLAMENKKVLIDICILHGIDPNRIEEICTTYDINGNE